MGPGYFPFALGLLLAGLGAVLLWRSLLPATGDRKSWPALQLKPLAIVLLSVFLFSQLLRPLGLVLSTALLVLSCQQREPRVPMAGGPGERRGPRRYRVVVFVYFLEFQIPVWPALLAGIMTVARQGRTLMDLLANLALGFQTAVSPMNLLYCLAGP